ncbi:MAG: hypothetical protein GWM98_13625 [Nitrospinaceae bacterium]|nr:UTP--glucose-1-phosphate uridylyltransferase [Nitrospinaceae bacterium]NIR55319.1 UTP--glucose-1-phosphate uridylyltransferase [Nitrospinaceae bacterium]NIS85758.1 UTP--glucose-1-phosphate uridylyltransferase [Nitrospinaceae bacterium]NIT82608.1 UTP--glucose-1-phosphate uridylyltransferase [Nitrospinaceae bacterium]NIU44813.1 UTP--glucose-1-phosphate uridylyltransferase [Nitrospinaceae bacterium]
MELSEFEKVLGQWGLPEAALRTFSRLYSRYQENISSALDWESIRSPEASRLIEWGNLPVPDDGRASEALSRLVVCKLNGGLGTSMGCQGPKSSIVVQEGKSFLDLIVMQLEDLDRTAGASIPLLLMNSFYTHEDTRRVLEGMKCSFPVNLFQQNRFLRLDKETGHLLDPGRWGNDAWYPPGHGDIYSCLYDQGILERYLTLGKEILFVSNADNLGAVIDPRIVHFMLKNDVPFLMEMTPKTPADIKGGTLYQDAGGKLCLLELAQVPAEYRDEFCSTRKFKVFNTNNIWINLKHLKRRMDRGPLDLNLIINEKQVKGHPVIQLETAIGAALEHFDGAIGLVVGRERFLPVKNTSDLMLIQSNLFTFRNGRMIRNPAFDGKELPLIKWASPFTHLEEFQKRIPVLPDLRDLVSLTLEGDVAFEGEVQLKGKVTLISREKPIRIPAGALLENCETVQ